MRSRGLLKVRYDLNPENFVASIAVMIYTTFNGK